MESPGGSESGRQNAGGRSSFSSDVLWNVASLGVAGVCGVALNYSVGAIYGAAVLGVFNQVFAVYLVASQLAALGVHTSVLTHGAATADAAERRAIFGAGLAVTALQAIAVVAMFLAAAGPVADLLDSPDVATGMIWAAPGLVCFALNKVLLAVLNTLQRMRWYAVFQAGRIVFMAVGFAGCVLVGASATSLPVILSVGEATVLVAAIAVVSDQLGRTAGHRFRPWMARHWRFGARGFLSGLFSDLNTRIDVLILGAFASDRAVGAYSLAALMAEGMYQILIALRTNYAPIMVRLLATARQDELLRAVRKGRNRTYLGALGAGALAILAYALIVPLTTTDPSLQHSWVYFAILMGGMAASAGYAPFSQLLLWAGRPGWHTILIGLIVGVGAAVDTAAVSMWGATGAAIGTAATYAWSVVALKALVSRVLGLRI